MPHPSLDISGEFDEAKGGIEVRIDGTERMLPICHMLGPGLDDEQMIRAGIDGVRKTFAVEV
jgi:hypothetical protein